MMGTLAQVSPRSSRLSEATLTPVTASMRLRDNPFSVLWWCSLSAIARSRYAAAGLVEMMPRWGQEAPWFSRRILSLGKRGCGYGYTEDAGESFYEEVLGGGEGPGGAAGAPVARRGWAPITGP